MIHSRGRITDRRGVCEHTGLSCLKPNPKHSADGLKRWALAGRPQVYFFLRFFLAPGAACPIGVRVRAIRWTARAPFLKHVGQAHGKHGDSARCWLTLPSCKQSLSYGTLLRLCLPHIPSSHLG